MLRTSELFTLESRPVPLQCLASLLLSLVFCGAFNRAKEIRRILSGAVRPQSFNLSFVGRRVELSNEEFVIFQHHLEVLKQELAMSHSRDVPGFFTIHAQSNKCHEILARVRGEFKLWPPNSCASGPTILVRMARLWVSRQIRVSGHCPPHHENFPPSLIFLLCSLSTSLVHLILLLRLCAGHAMVIGAPLS